MVSGGSELGTVNRQSFVTNIMRNIGMSVKYLAAGMTAAALTIFASSASAATMSATFDLTGNDSLRYNNLSNALDPMTQGGLTATFKAGSTIGNITGVSNGTTGFTNIGVTLANDPHIGRYGGGAGVVNSTGDNDHQVDGSGYRDFIEVVFSQAVRLTSVDFSFFGGNDNMRWLYDANEDGKIDDGDFISFSQSSDPFTNFGGVSSKVWGIMAFDSNDEWKLRAVTAEYDVPGVPLPAAGWMLIGALGGMGALRRRQKKA
ncbi:VPLPA-CTERM sorting domain-containing protein [Roseobacter sp. EG26]